MNKFIILLSIFFAFNITAQAQKVGYIDSQQILASFSEVKQANSDLEVMKSMFRKKGEEMVKDLQGKYQILQQKQSSGELAPVEVEKQAAMLKLEEAKLGEFEKESQQKIVDKTEELLKPIQDKVNAAIKEVATESGFLYIFDSSVGVVLYGDPSVDATKLVKTKLGITAQ